MTWRLLVLVAVSWAGVSHAAPVRLLLSVGHDVGHLDDVPLHHAQSDAARVRDVFVEIGAVRSDDATVIVGQPAAEVRLAVAALASRAAALRAQGQAVVVLVYVSSHASAGTLRLGESELSLTSLRASVADLDASLRVLVVDACTSGVVVRQKGVSRVASSVELDVSGTKGLAVITSSGAAEASQEWDSLSGSLFTHHWLGALRGAADLNHDGRVTLSEAYSHAHAQTIAAGAQHPSYDFDLSGSDDVVLTEPRRSQSAVEFSSALSGRFVVAADDGAGLVLEVHKSAGAPLRLALPPGRYRIQRREARVVQLASVALPWGGLTLLDGDDFVEVGLARIALKGSGAERLGLGLTIGALSDGVAVKSALPSLGAWARVQFGVLWLGFGVDVSAGGGRQQRYLVDELLFSGAVSGGASAQWAALRCSLGLVARPVLVTQDLRRVDAREAAERFGVPPAQARFGVLVEVGAVASFELALSGPFFAGLSVEGLARVSKQDERAVTSLSGRVAVLTGLRF